MMARRVARTVLAGAAPRERCEVDGLTMLEWVALWAECHANVQGSLVRIAWPDGQSTIEQPALVVSLFGLITEEALKEQEAARKRAEQQRH